MPPAESDVNEDPPPSLPQPGWAAWRVLVWVTLTVFLFNCWAFWAYGNAWKEAIVPLEIPSHDALAHGHLWTLLTYAITSAGMTLPTVWLTGPLSILFLMILAQLAEAEMSRRDFILLCFVCALGGAATWLPFHWNGDDALLSGCMVLVPGLLAFWCFAMPDEPLPMRLFMTFEVRPQSFFWVVLALEAGSFLSFELPKAFGHPGAFKSTFDNSAHLGAMIAGWAFACVWKRNLELSELPEQADRPARPLSVLPVGVKRAATAETAATGQSKAAPATRRELREEVDRILDKINKQGFGALTAQEKQTLDRARSEMKK